MSALQEAGLVPTWGSAMNSSLQRRNVFLGELKQMGILSPEQLATPSIRDDAAFLFTTVGERSIINHASRISLIEIACDDCNNDVRNADNQRFRTSCFHCSPGVTSIVALISGVVLPGDWVRSRFFI